MTGVNMAYLYFFLFSAYSLVPVAVYSDQNKFGKDTRKRRKMVGGIVDDDVSVCTGREVLNSKQSNTCNNVYSP